MAIGRTNSDELKVLTADFVKRTRRFVPFEMQVIPEPKNAAKLKPKALKKAEASAVLDKLAASDQFFLFDEKGKNFTSRNFATFLQRKMSSGAKNCVFLIGGAYGFDEQLYQRADGKIALSQMTFSHQMVRLIAAEQIYRGLAILKNHPYHND